MVFCTTFMIFAHSQFFILGVEEALSEVLSESVLIARPCLGPQ